MRSSCCIRYGDERNVLYNAVCLILNDEFGMFIYLFIYLFILGYNTSFSEHFSRREAACQSYF